MALTLSSTQYAHIESVVTQDENTFVGWFAPSFATNDASQRFFFDVDNLDYSMYNTGAANTITTTADGRTYDFTVSSWTPNDWLHVAFAFQKSGDIHKVWINGSPLTSSGDGGVWGSTTVSTSDRLFIGKQASSGGVFTGKSAEISVFNRMLTDAEVAVLAQAFSPTLMPFRDALVGYWDLIRPNSASYFPRFGEMSAVIVGSPAVSDHPRIFYSTSQHIFEPQQPLSPPVVGRISESFLAGTGIIQEDLGTQEWINPENINFDNEEYASITLEAAAISSTLRSSTHGFNLPPQAVIEGVQIEVEFNFDGEFLNIFQLYDGVTYGTPLGQVIVGGSGSAHVVYGDNTELWGLTLTPAKVNGAGFGFGFVAQDINTTSPTIDVDYIRITVHWSAVGAVTYTETPTGGLEGGGIGGYPYRTGTGGSVSGGIAEVDSSETKTPTGGSVGGGLGKYSPYLIGDYGTELQGGLVISGSGKWNIAPGISGGSVGGGIAIKGFFSPLESVGLLANGEALLDPIFGEGGIVGGGVAEDESRTPEGGSVGGSIINSEFIYNPTPEGGLSAGGTRIDDTYTETPDGGTVASGTTIPRPHFIGEYGTELQGGGRLGESIIINGDPEGGVLLTSSATPMAQYTLTGSGGAKGSGIIRQIDFVSATGGSVGGGTAQYSLTIAVFGGGTAGGPTPPNNQVEYVERNPSVSGGGVVSGDVRINFTYTAGTSGEITIAGSSTFKVGYDYFPSGDGSGGAGVIIQPIVLTASIDLIINGTFTGSTITVDGTSTFTFEVNYLPTGGITINGKATPIRATYLGLVADGGMTISGYSAAWFIRTVLEPRISDALNMKSDNVYKDRFLTTETQLYEEYSCGQSKNPVLCETDFSAKVLQQNKVQGGFLPTATVIRQRKHLPTPKQESRSRSVQLADLS